MSGKKTVKVTTKPKVVKKTTQTVKKQAKKVTSSAKPVESVHVKAPVLDNETRREVFNSFSKGKAEQVTYRGGTTLYRVGGKGGNYWSLSPPPATEYQWRVNYAIKQEFGNDASKLYTITIPEGSSITAFEGSVSSQGMGLYGGAHQAYINFREVPKEWIKIEAMTWR